MAGVLRFDGTDDKIKWATLASALSNVSDGAWTLAVVFRTNSLSVTLSRSLSYLLSGSGAGTAEAGASITDNGASNEIRIDVDAGPRTTTDFTNITDTQMVVISKGAGTVAPRIGFKAEPGGGWTHENFGATLADQIDATMLEIGAWQGTDVFDGWIGVVAYWEGAMSDANKEALDNNWRTSDLWTSAHGTPVFLAELNVAGASVVDLAGNATSITATGTTLDAGETLDSWNFDGMGPAVLEQTHYRWRADDGTLPDHLYG